MKSKKKLIGTIVTLVGAAMMIVAMGLWGYHIWDAKRAESAAKVTVHELNMAMPTVNLWQPSEDTESDTLPTVNIDGVDYIGRLDIPELDLSLPVASVWSEDELKIAPCRYSGTGESDLIIGANAYDGHFGRLKELSIGSTVTLTRMDGKTVTYRVSGIDKLSDKDTSKLVTGDWDMTLFTGSSGKDDGIALRCSLDG
jgi:sortase A